MEYPFIAIAPRFTLTQCGSTWYGPINGSNRKSNCANKRIMLNYHCYILIHRFITWPNNSSSNSIINNLNKLDVKTTSLPSKMICDFVHSIPQRNIFSDAGVSCIPCKNRKLKYIGETSRKFHVLLKEHKRDMRIGNLNNALFQHISQSNHNFDFNSARCSFTFIIKD